jgi:hypothetical protein
VLRCFLPTVNNPANPEISNKAGAGNGTDVIVPSIIILVALKPLLVCNNNGSISALNDIRLGNGLDTMSNNGLLVISKIDMSS